jgi:hypothetical protein
MDERLGRYAPFRDYLSRACRSACAIPSRSAGAGHLSAFSLLMVHLQRWEAGSRLLAPCFDGGGRCQTSDKDQTGRGPSLAFLHGQEGRRSPEARSGDQRPHGAGKARTMPHGPARNEAMKHAGILRNAADMQGLLFVKRGRPTKT